jgi:colicin import membrane protein
MMQEERSEPGKKPALILTVVIHLLLVLALFLGVQWKTEHVAVEVELWSPAPHPATSLPPPSQAEPKQEIKRPEPTPEKTPDIVVKKDNEKKPKPEEKPPVKPEVKPDPVKELQKQAADEERQRRKTAEATERANREAAMREMADAEQRSAGRKSAEATWAGKIHDKIRGNIVLPQNVQGNPEAVFEINLLPTCEVVGQPRLVRSSGNPALDDAIARAILKSDPLPQPNDPSVFQRQLKITYRPYE